MILLVLPVIAFGELGVPLSESQQVLPALDPGDGAQHVDNKQLSSCFTGYVSYLFNIFTLTLH